MIRAILDALATPDDQGRDWYGWTSTQMAHGLIGATLTGALVLASMGAWWAAALAAVGYAGAKEAPDVLRVPTWRTARDSLHDSLFVAGGAVVLAATVAGAPWVFGAAVALVVIGLALGVAVRIRK